MSEDCELIHHKDWNIDEEITGRFTPPGLVIDGRAIPEGLPIIGVRMENGLNDQEPDGSFVPCNMGIVNELIGVTPYRVNRARCEVRFADTADPNKHLAKVKYKNGIGRSFKYERPCDLPDVTDGKPKFTADNGVRIEHFPRYNGVQIDIVLADPKTAPTEHIFTIKGYGGADAPPELQPDGSIVLPSPDGGHVYMGAPYATDSTGATGLAHYVILPPVGALHRVKKVVDETWLRNVAVGETRLDPVVTISGTTDIVDSYILNFPGFQNNNYGATTETLCYRYHSGDVANALARVNLSVYAGATVTLARWNAYVRRGGFPFTIQSHECLRSWNELEVTGVVAHTTPSVENWTATAAEGVGTDVAAAIDSSTTITGAGAYSIPVSAGLATQWCNGQNYGNLWRGSSFIVGRYVGIRSTESLEGFPLSFYMEYALEDGLVIYRRRRGY